MNAPDVCLGVKIVEVRFSSVALKDLGSLPDAVARRIVQKVERLIPDLAGDVKVLTNRKPQYRLRVGDDRALFDVTDGVVLVLTIRHRRNAYNEGEV